MGIWTKVGVYMHAGHTRTGGCTELTPEQRADHMLPCGCTMITMESKHVAIDCKLGGGDEVS